MNRTERKKLTRAFAGLIGCKVDNIDFPGGKSRKSFRLHLQDGRTVIATKRNTAKRATLETKVMRTLKSAGADVPEVIAFNGLMMVQEDLGEKRLSSALQGGEDTVVEDLLDRALSSLAIIHKIAHEHGLQENVPAIGNEITWLEAFAERPFVLGQYLDVAPPKLDRDAIVQRLSIAAPRFVKWDARPGNALVRANGDISWFDWEHCGARDPLDDVAWLLGDEFVPRDYDAEARLLEKHLPNFQGARTLEDARDYFYTFGSYHSLVRLGLILDNKEDDDWWDFDYCLKGDKVGVTKQCARRLAKRGYHWSSQSQAAGALAPWFTEVDQRLKHDF